MPQLKRLPSIRVIALALLVSATTIYSTGCQSCPLQTCKNERLVIGENAWITVENIDHSINARIDTGARTTSIHALDIVIEGAKQEFDANVGKPVSFTIIDAAGQSFHMQSTISGVTKVRNAQGVEMRYNVPMILTWGGVSKSIKVNLRDRSAMSYKLLIGRDWLSEDFLVNVDIKQDD